MVGIIITDAKVHPYNRLEVSISLENLIDYLEIQKRSVPQNQDWVKEQQQKAANDESYVIATKENPLTGFGVGILPFWNGKYLMGGKINSENEVKITSIIGHPETYEELLHPLTGALREFCEEVSFRDGNKLCYPKFSGAKDLDKGIIEPLLNLSCLGVYMERFPTYNDWGLVSNLTFDKLDYELGKNSPVDLTEILIYDQTNQEDHLSKGFFYWDPRGSRLNIIYPLTITTDTLPFSSENKYGTKEIDQTSCLIEVDEQTMFNLNQPLVKTFKVYTAFEGKEQLIKTIPGGFNRAMKDYRERRSIKSVKEFFEAGSKYDPIAAFIASRDRKS